MTARAAATLRTTLSLAEPALRHAAALVWQPVGLVDRYPEYLRTMHAIVRASVPLMEAAAARCADERLPRTVADPLRGYLAEHIAEELDHDRWLLEDLAVIDARPVATDPAPPDVPVAHLVGAQYYWIHHHHPVSLLGYIAVLEGNAPSPLLADHLAAVTGLPAAAFRTLRHHAVVDVVHSDAVDALLDRLPLTSGEVSAVTVSALSTVAALADIFAHLGGSDGHQRT